jgi:hypothetical protein
MSQPRATSAVSLQALLERGKVLPRSPSVARGRVLARARTTAASPPAAHTSPAVLRPRFPPQLLAPAAAAAFAVVIAGSVHALSGGWGRAAATAPLASAPAISRSAEPPPSAAVKSPEPAAASVEPRPVAPAASVAAGRQRRAGARQGSYDEELELLRNAHTAYGARDYASALELTREHARRFASGPLAEQREALRVRCLLGANRAPEARRAAALFATRFPRSVLLRRLQAEVGAAADAGLGAQAD